MHNVHIVRGTTAVCQREDDGVVLVLAARVHGHGGGLVNDEEVLCLFYDFYRRIAVKRALTQENGRERTKRGTRSLWSCAR